MVTQYPFYPLHSMLMYDATILSSSSSPIFIPRKHPKMKYADHKRMKTKRKNKKR